MYSRYKIKLIFVYIKFMCSTASIFTQVMIGIRSGRFVRLYTFAQMAFDKLIPQIDKFGFFESIGITNIRHFTFGGGVLLSCVSITLIGTTLTLTIMNAFIMIGWFIHFLWNGDNAIMLSFAFLELGSIGAMNTNIVYITEIVEPELRGFFSGLLVAGYSVGLIASLFLDWKPAEKFYKYDSVTLVCMMISGLCLISTLAIPEPPIRLLLNGKERSAKNVFLWLHDNAPENEITSKYQDLVDLADKHVNKREGNTCDFFCVFFFSKAFLKPLALVFLICTAHICILFDPVVQYFRFKTFHYFKKVDPVNFPLMLFAYSTKFFLSLAVSLIIHTVKRRPIFFVSAFSSAYSLMLLITNEIFSLHTPAINLVYISYIIFASFGLSTIPFFIMAEYFPQPFRQYGSGLALVYINYASIYTIIRGGPTIDLTNNPVARSTMYWFCLLAVLISTIVLFPIMPETEGLSLSQLENLVVEGPWIPKRDDTPVETEDADPATPEEIEIEEEEEDT